MDADADFSRLFTLLGEHEKIVLAVSGGSDSTALMVLAADWARKNNGCEKIAVVTVDHRLRDGAAREARQVGAWAKALGLEATTIEWQHARLDSGIQQKARQARYQLLGRFCRENGFAGVITAHNRDDQAETLLMRLARGSGVDGLAAMADHNVVEGVDVFRPLLDVSRAQLRQVLEARGHGWIEDPSNEDAGFERVRVRAELARLGQSGISAKNLARAARRAARASRALEVFTDKAINDVVKVFDSGHCELDASAFTAMPEEIAIRVLGRLIDWAGSGEEYLKLAKLEGLFERLCNDGQDQYTLAGAQIVRRKAVIVIGREFGRIKAEICKQVTVWDKRFCFAQPVDVAPYGLFIDEDDRPRPPELPHFVACALPALCRNGVLIGVPQLDGEGQNALKLAKMPKGVENNAVLSR